jgi:hypothetical protein
MVRMKRKVFAALISFFNVLLIWTFAGKAGGLIAVVSASGAAPGADAEILGPWKGITFQYPQPLDLTRNAHERGSKAASLWCKFLVANKLNLQKGRRFDDRL